MKILVSFLFFCCLSLNVIAIPDIVAVINQHPITAYDLNERKKMIGAINNIENITTELDKQLTNVALKSLIDEEILFEHAKNIKAKISDEEIADAIVNIEEKNKAPKGYLLQFLKSKNVDINSFKSQIKSEIIKMNIMSQFSRSVAVTPREIDAIVLTDNQRDVDIEAIIFVSDDKSSGAFAKMSALQKNIKNCAGIADNLYNKFASKETFAQNLSQFNSQLQTIIKDLPVGKASNIIESDEGFKLVLVCKKNIKFLNEKENELVVNFLTNKKISQKAKQFLAALRKKSSIKIFIN